MGLMIVLAQVGGNCGPLAGTKETGNPWIQQTELMTECRYKRNRKSMDSAKRTRVFIRRINWKRTIEVGNDMELHIVHSNPNGGTAVVGTPYGSDSPHPFLSTLMDKIVSLGSGQVDLGNFDPNSVGFGGTEPYCRYARAVSPEQIQVLKDAVADGFEVNARPTQALNGRPVF
nr:alpha carbonic anhydrase 4-like [Ziziphus jujuba var. spinosa]